MQAEQEEKERVAKVQAEGRHELSRVATFATAMIKRYPQAKLSAGFVLRLAEAELELKNYTEARSLAKKAVAIGVQGDLRSQALWIKGSVEHEEKEFTAARATFAQLIKEFPRSKLTEGARWLLAMTAEDQGDLETALEQYLALHYDFDVAYFIDVLLPTERLANFVTAHEELEQNNELLYALGIRYMRDKQWENARDTFRRVRTEPDTPITYSEPSERVFVKEPDWGERQYIKTSWVMQDLKTIDVLEHLEQVVESAQGDEAKAEAMYQLASFQFDANALLFYNPAAWSGMRYELLSQLDLGDNMRQPNESQIIFDYSQKHETLARAIPIYTEIVERYPQTKAARDALFSAAVANEHLGDLNPYWRKIYARGLFAGDLHVTFSDLNRLYPNFRWPKSRNGWEASTRTVNGGPAYVPLPKPAAKLTLEQRVERKFKKIVHGVETSFKSKVNDSMIRANSFINSSAKYLLVFVGLFFVGYLALLILHFRKPQPVYTARNLEIENKQEIFPNSESRMTKIIDDK